jgi:hypothetical protein
MNDVFKSGDELIAAERERQVLVHGHTIVSDCRKNKNGELLQMAAALIYYNMELAPKDWDQGHVKYMMDKDGTDRLIYAGAFISAEIDRRNLLKQIDDKMNADEPETDPEM